MKICYLMIPVGRPTLKTWIGKLATLLGQKGGKLSFWGDTGMGVLQMNQFSFHYLFWSVTAFLKEDKGEFCWKLRKSSMKGER